MCFTGSSNLSEDDESFQSSRKDGVPCIGVSKYLQLCPQLCPAFGLVPEGVAAGSASASLLPLLLQEGHRAPAVGFECRGAFDTR